jgi:hypothetical protein
MYPTPTSELIMKPMPNSRCRKGNGSVLGISVLGNQGMSGDVAKEVENSLF